MSLNSRSNKQKADLERTLEKILLAEQQLRDHLTARFSEVDSKNAILDQSRSQLENLLKTALSVDTFVDFDSLKVQARLPSFKRKEPILQRYLPAPLSGLGSWLPWKKRAYDKACTSAERKYKQDCEIYRETLFNHKKQISQLRAETEKLNQEIEQFQQDFAAGGAQAVIRYFNRVLTNSEYPAGFSKNAKLAYFPESRLLKISYEMPATHIISEIKAYKYAKSRDEITGIVLPQKQRRQFYLSVLAQTCLRTIYEILTADRTEKIERIAFDGYVDAINPSTGQPGRFHLIALNVQREHFLNLNLERVEPVACLKGLNARLSSKPDQMLPVSSNLSEERGGAQESADSHAGELRTLNTRIGELENEIQRQKERNAALENELSDKRDRIAELVHDLRDEQERTAVLSAAIHAQKDSIVELELKPGEEPGDTQLAEAITEKAEESAIVEAGIFTPIDIGTSEDDSGGLRIPPREAEADKPVTLSDLLRKKTKLPGRSENEPRKSSGYLPDIHELVFCINWLGEAEAKLLAVIEENRLGMLGGERSIRFWRTAIHKADYPQHQ